MFVAHDCKEGKYEGETCLIGKGWPVTNGGSLDCSRVRAALTYGSKFNKIGALKDGGLCEYVRRCNIEAKVCGD